MTLSKKWAIWKSDYDQSSCAYLRSRKRGSEVEREGWAGTGRSEDPTPVGSLSDKGEEKDRGPRATSGTLAWVPRWWGHLWGHTRGQLGENQEFEYMKVQEARSPRLLVFWNLGERSAACTHLKWRRPGKRWVTSGWKASLQLRATPSCLALAKPLPHPALPDSSSGHVHSQVPFSAVRPPPWNLGPREQAWGCGWGGPGSSLPRQPRQGQWDPRGGWMFVQMTCLWPSLSLLMLLASPCWFWLGGSQFCCWIWEPWGWGWTELPLTIPTQDGSSPFPPIPLDFIFSHTQLYYRMLASQSLKGPRASLIQCLLFWMKKLRPRGRKGLAQGHPSRWGQKIQTSSHVAQGSETTLQTSASLVAVLFGTGQFSFFELAIVTFSSPREAADSDGLSAFTV